MTTRIRLVSFLAIAFLAMAAVSFLSTDRADAVESFHLDNGLQVVVIPQPSASQTVQMMLYRIGARDDPPSKSGLAHFVEHLTFGSRELDKGSATSKFLMSLGEAQGAFTGPDHTAFYQTIRRDQLEVALQLEAERMSVLSIDGRSFEFERAAVDEERRELDENDPQSVLEVHLQSALFGDHPYAAPVLGWQREVKMLTPNDAREFHRQWYVINNAILLVAGPVTTDTVLRLASRYFGAMVRTAIPDRKFPVIGSAPSRRPVVVTRNGAKDVLWMRLYKAPSFNAGRRELSYPLTLVAAMINDDAERQTERVAALSSLPGLMGAEYDPDRSGPATFSLQLRVHNPQALQSGVNLVDARVGQLALELVSNATLRRAKDRVIEEARDLDAHLLEKVQNIGIALAGGRPVEAIERWLENIEAVTAEQVRAAARRTFTETRNVTGTLVPGAKDDVLAAHDGERR